MKRLVKYTVTLLLLAVSQVAFAQVAIIYVSLDGDDDANDGTTSWGSAFKTVGKALDEAAVLLETEPSVEIWIAKGTYIVDSPLTMRNDVGIFGGFAGIDGEGKEDRVAANVTVLDGEGRRRVFNNDFTPEEPLEASAVLDTVTIANGYRAGYGGGMYNYYASPSVTNCTFVGNTATRSSSSQGRGGGMYNANASPIITDCTFSGNQATGTSNNGGGMSNYFSSPIITNCAFNENKTGFNGGGMFNYSSSPVIAGCTFSGNKAGGDGGGMYNNSSSAVTTSCTFSGNQASSGGAGMYNGASSGLIIDKCTFSRNVGALYSRGGGMYNSNSSAAITDCTFSGNQVGYDGGGMYNSYSSPTIENCLFGGNQSNSFGGGICNSYSSPAIANCTFSGNQSRHGGGGTSNEASSSPTIANCTFSGNGSAYGGGMYNASSSPTVVNCTFGGNAATYGGGILNVASDPAIANCIIWGNTPKVQIYNDKDKDISPSNPQVTNSIVQGGYEGTGNKNADPLLMPLGNYGGPVPTMPVREGSPARGAGTGGTSIPPEDAIGQARTFPCTLGAVEFDETMVAIVVKGGSTRFLPGTKFTLEVHAVSAASYQWYKNGVPVEGETNSTFMTAQFDPAVTYHCVVTLSGGGTQTTASVEITTDSMMRPAFSVYETKVSARTSTIKHMSAKIEYRKDAADPWKTKSVQVHYLAPVSKGYTILMAYDGSGNSVYHNTGSGRMWANDKQYRFEFRGENYLQEGQVADNKLSHIGAKGHNIPETGRYFNASDQSAPEISFAGLATLDWKNGGRVAGSTGVVLGKNFEPVLCERHDVDTQGMSEDWEDTIYDWKLKAGCYYPQPYEAKSGKLGEFQKAHFFGTYTTRYNAAKSKALDWPMVESLMDEKWVPKGNREREEKDDDDGGGD